VATGGRIAAYFCFAWQIALFLALGFLREQVPRNWADFS
jgi:hypothetical protein